MLLCVLATLYYLLMHNTEDREEAEEAIIADEMLISFRSSMHVIRLALFVKNKRAMDSTHTDIEFKTLPTDDETRLSVESDESPFRDSGTHRMIRDSMRTTRRGSDSLSAAASALPGRASHTDSRNHERASACGDRGLESGSESDVEIV